MTTRATGKHRVLFLATIGFAVALHTAAASADEVTSKGTVLRGKVTGLSPDGVTFEPEYGTGALAIKWADIEDIKTEGSMQVLHGDGLEADAPLQGISAGNLLVGTDPAAAIPIELASLHSGVAIGPDGPSWRDRTRSYWRYWDGNLDFALNYQQATVDTTGFLLGFRTIRTKDPTRFILAADYRYSTQERKGESGTTIEDRAYGLIRGEYDLTSRLYAYASGDATYDAIQQLSIRGVPQGGLGYLIWEEKLEETKRNFLSAEAGLGWVYERYFAERVRVNNIPVEPPQFFTPEDNFFTVAFGAAAGYHLPFGAHAGWTFSYLPAVDDWANDYLIRTAFELTMPVVDPIAAKFSLLDEYDSTPAANTDRNSLFIVFGLSILW